jgi:hypothetical protein
VLGTEAIAVEGTEFGTLVQATMTEFGELAIVITNEAGSDETSEAATTTGELQELGTTTVAGTTTNELTATDTKFDDGIVPIIESGIDDGTFE